MTDDRRLIEDYLPIEAISVEARKVSGTNGTRKSISRWGGESGHH